MPQGEKKPPEQIPWAEYVRVSYQSDSSIDLKRGKSLSADVWHKDFEWSVAMNSKIDIDDYMKLDERLTKDIQDYWEAEDDKHTPSTFQDRIMKWLKGTSYGPVTPAEGPKEWRPKRKFSGIKAKLSDTYGYANTTNEDPSHYWGDVFEFAHFDTEDGEEGAVIIWHGGGDPRGNYGLPMVYLGQFEEFMDSQYEHDAHSFEAFRHWNETFENGFMWAWHKLGVFKDWDEHVEDYDDRHVKQVLRAIEQDPTILLPESVEQILENGVEDYPKEIRKAVGWLSQNKRREIEGALGQQLIWGDLYLDE